MRLFKKKDKTDVIILHIEKYLVDENGKPQHIKTNFLDGTAEEIKKKFTRYIKGL